MLEDFGVTRLAINNALGKGFKGERLQRERSLNQFLFGDVRELYSQLPGSSNRQGWETRAKRFLQLEEARWIAKHYLRNNLSPKSHNALVLTGTEPALACIPWAKGGLATSFIGWEKDLSVYQNAIRKEITERRKIEKHASYLWHPCDAEKKVFLYLREGNCFKYQSNIKYGVFDLDFCNNHLRTQEGQREILSLIKRSSPKRGPFVLRTTLHVGRNEGNSKADIEGHIRFFERSLREDGWNIRAQDRNPYQSTVPMISLIWILESPITPEESGKGKNHENVFKP